MRQAAALSICCAGGVREDVSIVVVLRFGSLVYYSEYAHHLEKPACVMRGVRVGEKAEEAEIVPMRRAGRLH